MVSVKLIAIPSSIVGVLGVTSPLMHISATSSSYESKWHVSTNFEDPILKDCKESSGNKHFTVFLEFQPRSGVRGNSDPKIFFRVEETVGTWNKQKDKKVVWRGGKGIDQHALKWEKWKLDKKSDEVLDFMYPEGNVGSWERFGNTTCDKERKIKPSSSKQFGSGNPVEVQEIKLILETGNSCKRYFSSVECDVKIEASDKLKWDENFSPKVTWRVFP